jgi:hypothetical protein
MVEGVYLSLLVGPVVPVPVPSTVIDALNRVQVTIATREQTLPGQPPRFARSGFELEFNLGKRSPLETLFLLAGGATPPLLRLILVATIAGTTEVIIDGFVQQTDLKPAGSHGPATLTVRGKDVTALMDFIEFNGLPFPAMPVPARVALILAKYALLGVIPIVIPPVFPDIPDPTERIFAQQGTDYAYLCTLAAETGYVFYVDAGPVPGTNRAYWGPEIKVGVPQPALNLDMDALTNVETMTFRFDTERATTPVAFLRLDAVPVPIPVPIPEASLINPPLGLIPPLSMRLEPLPDVSKLSMPQALLFGLSRSAASSECVQAEGSLNVLRYGRLLKARQLVGVRGAGTSFDGLYYVQSVTHDIKRGEYKQAFKVTRNGLVSTVPRVPV